MDEPTTQWDYWVGDFPKFQGDGRAEVLNEMGALGWEMCGFSDNGNWNFTIVFKRPRPDVPTRPVEIVSD